MSNSKNWKKDRIIDFDDEEVIRKPKLQNDKRKEKRIQRALKTKNVEELLKYDEESFIEEEENINESHI